MRYLIISLFFSIFSFPSLFSFEGSSYLFCSKKDSLPYLIPKSISLNPKGNVFIWMNAECPICNKYPNIWKKLALEFPEFTFIGVFTSYEESKMAKGFMKKYKIPFQWFIDKENHLANYLSVNVTPEVLFFNADAEIVYRGATDDWFYALGKTRTITQHLYLKNALMAQLNNKSVLIFKTDPIGCIFN
ncbi:MAG: redoxin family protein [Bacteroidota bacterium]